MPAPSSRAQSPPDAFAAVLRRERETAGLTQAELADRAGLGVRTVSNLERGINTAPYLSTVRLLADGLGLSEDGRGRLLRAARGRGAAATAQGRPTGGYLGARPATPLVAREAERAALAGALDAVAGGVGKVVLLAGEPGIGKTRLAQEASAYAVQRGFLVATGRGFQTQRGTPFAPFLEVVATLHAAAPARVREEIPERWPPLRILLPDEFPSVPSTTAPPADAAQRLYRSLAGFVRELAALQPVAIVLDDLHWADGASLELFAHLARHTPEDRVLLLGTYRDVEVGRSHPLRELAHALRRDGILQTLPLARLDREETARLITEHLDDAPVSEEFGFLVHRRTDGNPFFTVEILTALIERGDLSRVEGHWVRGELADLEPPVSVSEAIGERVSRLAPASQEALEAVSVLGEVFDLDDLEILHAADTALEQALDEAVASGLLTTDGGRYTFDHVLTQQTLYSGLSPVRRRRLHRAAGEALERRPSAVRGRRTTDIARHLELGGAPERAVAYVLLAGDAAAAMHSQGEALNHYRHGLELADEAGDRAAAASALERLGHVHLSTANLQEAVDHLVRAADGYRQLADHAALLRVEGMIAHALHRQGAGEAAAARLGEVVTELDERVGPDGRTAGLAALCTGLARVRLALRQHGPALEAADRAARLAWEEGAVAVEADAEAVRGTVLLFLDRPDDAVTSLERALALAAPVEALSAISDAALALQWALTMRGELQRAREVGERGLEATRMSGDSDAEALHTADIGLTLFYAGEWETAQTYLERGVELARAGAPTLFSGIPPAYLGLLRRGQGDLAAATICHDDAASAPDLETFAFAAYVEARRAEVQVLRGRPDVALERLRPWLDQEAPTRIHDVMLLSVAAEACLALGDGDRAEELVDQALRRAAATKNGIDGVDAQRLKGCCLLLRGRYDAARSCLEEALVRAVAVPYPAAEARIRADLAALCRAAGQRVRAREHLAAAYEIFHRLGASLDATAIQEALQES